MDVYIIRWGDNREKEVFYRKWLRIFQLIQKGGKKTKKGKETNK